MKWSTVLLLLFTAVFILGCSLKEPGSPSWDVELTIPIANRVYALSDIVDDSAEVAENDSLGTWVSVVGDSLLRLNFADSLGPQDIHGKLQHDPIEKEMENFVGTMEVNPPGTRTEFYLVTDVNDTLLPGAYPYIPPFSFGPVLKTLLEFDEFKWVILDPEKSDVDSMWNTITVTLTNWFPFTLDSLMVRVYSINSSRTDSTLVFEIDTVFNFQSGDTFVKLDTLPSGQPIYSDMIVHLAGHSPGRTGPVTIQQDDRIESDIDLSTLWIKRAKAHIERHVFEEDSVYLSEEVDVLESASIREGYLSYYIDDQTGFADSIIFILVDFSREGDTLKLIHFLEPFGSVQVDSLDLSGYEFNRPQRDGRIESKIRVIIKDTARPEYYPNPPFIEVDSDWAVRADFQVSELTFSQFKGELREPKTVDFDPKFKALQNIPEGSDSIDVLRTWLKFGIDSYIGVDINIDLTIQSFRDGAVAVELPYSLLIPRAQEINNQWVAGTLDTTITGLRELLNILPDSIGAFGQASVQGEINISEDQMIEGVFVVFSPFAFTVGETTLKPEYTTLDEGFKNVIRQVDVTAFLESKVPLRGEIYIVSCSDTSFDEAVADVDTLMSGFLPITEIDQYGFTIQPNDTTYVETMIYSKLKLIAQVDKDNPLYIKTLLKLNSTNGEVVRFNPDDYIAVRAATHVILEVNADEDSEVWGGQ